MRNITHPKGRFMWYNIGEMSIGKNKVKSSEDAVACVAVMWNAARYDQCYARNVHVKNLKCVVVDNRMNNRPIPDRYNEFLDTYDYSSQMWFVFAHEDFEIRDNLVAKLADCDVGSLWSPIGCYRQSFLGIGRQRYVGTILDADRKTGDGFVLSGRPVKKGTKVETFDCCCLIVHSSLVQKHHLRFDPKLEFDLYVEDFCAMAKVRYGIVSRILPFESTHHSLSVPQRRYYDLLPYLRKKYPHNCFTGTCSYIGTMSPMMRFQRWLMGRADEDRKLGII